MVTTIFSFRQFNKLFVIPFCFSSLPKGVQIGRSEVKAVAEKRKLEIELFLATLFDLTAEISHSDLVYTFFHPLLRDQEDTDIHIKKLKNKGNNLDTFLHRCVLFVWGWPGEFILSGFVWPCPCQWIPGLDWVGGVCNLFL